MDLLEFEVSGDPSEAAAAGADVEAPAEASVEVEGDPSSAPEATAPAEAPEYLTAQEAADLADARFDARLNALMQQGGQQQETGEPLELLDELGQLHVPALMQMLQQRDQFIVEQMREVFAPVQSRYEREQLTEGEQRVTEILAGHDLGDQAKTAARQLAPAFLNETQRLYGQGTAKAAEAAVQKAAAAVKAIEAEAFKRGQAANATHLNAISSANAEPGTAGAAVSNPAATSVTDALERWKSRNGANLTAA